MSKRSEKAVQKTLTSMFKPKSSGEIEETKS